MILCRHVDTYRCVVHSCGNWLTICLWMTFPSGRMYKLNCTGTKSQPWGMPYLNSWTYEQQHMRKFLSMWLEPNHRKTPEMLTRCLRRIGQSTVSKAELNLVTVNIIFYLNKIWLQIQESWYHIKYIFLDRTWSEIGRFQGYVSFYFVTKCSINQQQIIVTTFFTVTFTWRLTYSLPCSLHSAAPQPATLQAAALWPANLWCLSSLVLLA